MENNAQTQNKCRWVYLVGFFLILALPLLSLPPWFSPPNWGKTIIFRIVLSILIFLFLWQFILSKNQQKISEISEKLSFLVSKKNKIFWLLVSFFGIYLLATIFSLDPNFSLWGSPYRSGGFVNFAFYIIFGILAFLILKKEDWPKIWDFSILIGIFVSIVAIFQWWGLFKDIFITYETRPPSTIGNPIFLALYFLLLSFLTLSFAIKANPLYKKLLYFSALLIFLFTILLTYSRAAYLGLLAGFLYFILFYPFKKRTVSLALKLAFFAILVFGIYGVYYVNTHPQLPEFIQENKTLRGMVGRFSIERALQDPRISGWKVSWEALKDRPLLGYGPENFAIGFDRYYDPSLKGIEKMPGTAMSWWGRAHNFVFDISLSAGIPALITYLGLFGVLFWRLQKLKKENPDQSLIYHGIQSTFLAYFVANFFSFDAFSTYLISFLLVGYSLHLISEIQQEKQKTENRNLHRSGLGKLRRYKGVILFLLFVLLVWFIWSFNIKPFQVNTEINLAKYESEQSSCQKPLERMEKILPKKSFLDAYLRLKYIEIINQCIEKKELKEAYPLAKKAVEILKENVKIRPYYTRNWLFLGKCNNLLMENWEENREKEARASLEKALELSPKRQEALQELIKTDLLTGKYQEAKEKSEECINLNEKLADCWWLARLSHAYLNDLEKSDYYLQIAAEKRYPVKSQNSWLQLTKAYIEIKNYPGLVETYSELIKLEQDNAQYYASLAFVYKELGQIEEAKKQALKIIELFPEHQKQAEDFLKTLE